MKITAKQFAGFKRAMTATGFNGVGFNDNWNMEKFGVTKRQHDALASVVGTLYGMAAMDEVRRLTLPTVKSFLDGKKTSLCYATDELVARVEAAFPG
jgi:hypothetical protein